MDVRMAVMTFMAISLVVVALAGQPIRAVGGSDDVAATDVLGLGRPVLPVAKRRVLPAPLPRTEVPAPAPQNGAGSVPGPSGIPMAGNGTTKCTPTDPVNITAHFWDTNSVYWGGQWQGMHNGTDFGGDPGQPVYAPFNMTIEYIGYYPDSGRIGYYVQSRLDNGYLYYSGHLGETYVQVGDYVQACTQIATIGGVYHTHVKIADPSMPIPCEATGCLDFEAYFNEH